MIDWGKYKSHPPTLKPNKMNIPINNFSFNDDDVSEFNEIYKYCLEEEAKGQIREMIFTPSNGISIKPENLKGARWHLTMLTSMIELTLRKSDGFYYRFVVGYGKKDKDKSGMTGRRAFQIYCRELQKDGIDIEDLACENGWETKQTIPSPLIKCFVPFCVTYKNAHHIDFNSSFNSGMIDSFPQLRPAVERMYNLRKVYPYFKEVLNMTQGFMQSELVNYRFSHISKAGYVWTNYKIIELALELKSNGRRVLGFNTDGIWYQGEIYHNEQEGTDLGQWKHDNINCKIRYKSNGCYEFIDENGIYNPRLRGQSSYERIKPREEWEWGDIFKGYEVKYIFVEGVGLENEYDFE